MEVTHTHIALKHLNPHLSIDNIVAYADKQKAELAYLN